MDPPEDMIEYFTYSLASITYVLVFILVRAPWRLYIRGPGAKLPGAVGWMERCRRLNCNEQHLRWWGGGGGTRDPSTNGVYPRHSLLFPFHYYFIIIIIMSCSSSTIIWAILRFQRDMHKRDHERKRSYTVILVLVATNERVTPQQIVNKTTLHLSESSL